MLEYLPKLLIVVGALLQFFVRARKGASEESYVVWAVGLCSAVYVLVHWPFGADPWNLAVVKGLVWLFDPAEGALIRVLAGTTATSMAANLAVKYGANAAHPAMPVTNSK